MWPELPCDLHPQSGLAIRSKFSFDYSALVDDVCNKCHDHPFERWTQRQYYELTASLTGVVRKPGAVKDEEIIYSVPTTGAMKDPNTGQMLAASAKLVAPVPRNDFRRKFVVPPSGGSLSSSLQAEALERNQSAEAGTTN